MLLCANGANWLHLLTPVLGWVQIPVHLVLSIIRMKKWRRKKRLYVQYSERIWGWWPSYSHKFLHFIKSKSRIHQEYSSSYTHTAEDAPCLCSPTKLCASKLCSTHSTLKSPQVCTLSSLTSSTSVCLIYKQTQWSWDFVELKNLRTGLGSPSPHPSAHLDCVHVWLLNLAVQSLISALQIIQDLFAPSWC